jgi:spore maturation protein CgeB
MRVMVIHPGHGFATHDVYTGLVAGLASCGADVIPYRLDGALDVTLGLYGLAQTHAPPLASHFDPYATASFAALGFAINKEVDWVLAVTGQNVHFTLIAALKKVGIKTALLCTESPYLTLIRERHDAALYDVVFTNDKNACRMFGKPAHYLPAAYNPAVHRPDGTRAEHSADVFFVGTGFPERQALIGGVDWSGIDLQLAGTLWDGNENNEVLLRRLMDNEQAAAHYRAAKINLNIHRTTADYHAGQHIGIGQAYSLGPRAYEIAACGGFQLMDDSRPEARDVFGASLCTFQAGNSADLERQIRLFLADPDMCRQYAQAQHEAVKPHTWHARGARVLDIFDGTRAGVSLQPTFTQEYPSWQPNTA